MEGSELVSVIVPVYNVARYLDRCVKSIQAQNYKNLEIILVDDGSSDESGMLCDLYGKCDERINVIHKNNGGLSSARNAGLNVASGEWISFVDSDDFVSENFIMELYSTCRKFGTELAACGRYDETDTGVVIKKYVCEIPAVFHTKDALKSLLIGKYFDVSACDKIYRKNLFDGIRYPLNQLSEDVAVIYDIMCRAGNIAHTGTALYHYANRPGSITTNVFDIKLQSSYDNYKFFYERVYEEEELEKEADVFYYRSLLYLLHRFYQKKIVYGCSMDEAVLGNNVKKEYGKIFRKCRGNKYLSVKEKLHGSLYDLGIYPVLKKLAGAEKGLAERVNEER